MFGELLELWHDEAGATMVEYAIMLGFIAAVCALAVGMVGSSVNGLFQKTANNFP